MQRIFLLVGTFIILSGVSLGQKGTAEEDYYPMGYAGDTWSGVVTAVNEDTREFTLTYKKGDKEQTFIGVLPKGYAIRLKNGKDHEVKMAELMDLRIKAYYMTKSKQLNGQKVKVNEVFKIKFY